MLKYSLGNNSFLTVLSKHLILFIVILTQNSFFIQTYRIKTIKQKIIYLI